MDTPIEQKEAWKMPNPFEQIDKRLLNIESSLLKLLKDPITAIDEQSKWFNVEELCNYLPDKPKRATLYGWVSAGTIPNHKSSKKLRFLKSEIDEWLKSGRRKTNSEIAEEASLYIERRRQKSVK